MEEIIKELELLLSDIAFSGLQNVHPVMLTKLENIQDYLKEAGMTGGTKQIERFIENMGSYQRGETPREELIKSFGALEFYQQTISNNFQSPNPE